MSQIIENKYFGNIIYFKKIVSCKYAQILPYVPYRKSHFLNRAVISGANGLIKLSIPVIDGRNQKTTVGQVRVSFQKDWRKDHWKAIISSYNKSPWFEYFYDKMSAYYKNEFDLLFDWNTESLNITQSFLGSQIRIKLLENAEVSTQPFDHLHHQVNMETQPEILAGGYPQVFEDRFGFIPNLSILDLIFCVGPHQAMKYLTTI